MPRSMREEWTLQPPKRRDLLAGQGACSRSLVPRFQHLTSLQPHRRIRKILQGAFLPGQMFDRKLVVLDALRPKQLTNAGVRGVRQQFLADSNEVLDEE